MDMVPKRIERYLLTNTDEAPLDYTISDEQVREAAGDTPIVRPIFEPGDAILFDEMVHSLDGVRPDDAQPSLRRRELVLWQLGLPSGLRTAVGAERTGRPAFPTRERR